MEGVPEKVQQMDTQEQSEIIDIKKKLPPDSTGDDFYIHVAGGEVSNTMDGHEDDTDFDFRYKLPNKVSIGHSEQWECALVELAYPFTSITVRGLHTFSVRLRGETAKYGASPVGDPVMYTLPEANYRSLADIVDCLNSIMGPQNLRANEGRDVKLVYDVSKLFMFEYMPQSRKVTIVSRIHEELMEEDDLLFVTLEMNGALIQLLGLPSIAEEMAIMNQRRRLPRWTVQMDRDLNREVYNLDSGNNHRISAVRMPEVKTFRNEMNIFMKELRSTFYRGDKMPILYRSVELADKGRHFGCLRVRRREYVPLTPGQTLDTLTFSLRDQFHRKVALTEGCADDVSPGLKKSYIKLHIRRHHPRR